MSALTQEGRFFQLTEDASCQRCGRPLSEHYPQDYGPPQARVTVLATCPAEGGGRATSERWCVDEHHDTPCPADYCNACKADCSGKTVSLAKAMKLHPELPASWFEEMSQ